TGPTSSVVTWTVFRVPSLKTSRKSWGPHTMASLIRRIMAIPLHSSDSMVDRVKVRRRMVAVVHVNRDAKKLADARHERLDDLSALESTAIACRCHRRPPKSTAATLR